MSRLAAPALAKIETRRFMGVEIPAKSEGGLRVLARWNDSESHPAIIEKKFGHGMVLLITTTADREWTDWPIDPTYVLAIRSAALAVARADNNQDNFTAGQMLEFRDDQSKTNPRLVRPDDPTPVPIVAAGTALRDPGSTHAGIYGFTWIDPVGKEQQHRLAVSFDKTASNLEPISETQLAQLLGTLHPQIVHYSPGLIAAAGPGRELWRMLATTLLTLLVVETLLAFWVGRER